MKSREDLTKEESELTEIETSRLRFLISEIDQIIDKPKVTEEMLRRVSNISVEVYSLKELVTTKIIRMLKRGYSID